MSKVALITGVNGQDGSYLVELLLSKGYVVHGIIRRASIPNTNKIDHLINNESIYGKKLFLHYGDMTDGTFLSKMISSVQPDEVYNLAAQSHVRISFDIPEYTGDVTGLGAQRLLEAIHNFSKFKNIRYYQASSSEMFGKVQAIPQNESTPFWPRSPYGCAKLYAHWLTINYRESYGLHASNGLLFNHETITSFTPMIYKREDDLIDIKPISEICRNNTGVEINEDIKEYQAGEPKKQVEIWDDGKWTKIKYVSCYPHKVKEDNKKPRFINARNTAIMATSEHLFFKEDGSEIECGNLVIGDKIKNIELPITNNNIELNEDLCFLLGAMAGDGYVEKNPHTIAYTCTKEDEAQLISSLWLKLHPGNSIRREMTTSGFTGKKNITRTILMGNKQIFNEFNLYNEDKTKRVPYQVLNSSKENMTAFLGGYNMANGLLAECAKTTYEFKNFKTNSATLAQGLIYLINNTTKQQVNITLEKTDKWGGKTIYYSINLLTPNSKLITNNKKLPDNEVKKIIKWPEYEGWFYDLETESGTFHCGVGFGHIHNSPRRGEEFVTRKITRAATRIALGLQSNLVLGNLEAKRDWGHAQDYVEAMWLMLQQDQPDDYVIATNETYSIKDFCALSFAYLNLDWEKYVQYDAKFERPAEVDILIGDYSKAKQKLGWEPKIKFPELVKNMIEHDLVLAQKELILKKV